VLIVTALVPLAALGLQLVCSKLKGRRSWKGLQTAPAAVVVAAMLISFLELAISPTKEHFRTDPLPPEYAALARTPRGIGRVPSHAERLHHLVDHLPASAPQNAGFGSPADALAGSSRSAARERLPRRIPRVTAIVTHPDALDYGADVPDVPNADWGPGYALVARAPDGSSTWRVTARPAPVLVTLPSGFGESEPARGHAVGFPLTSPSGVGYLEFRTREPRVIRLTFDAEPPTGASRVPGVADADSEGSRSTA
jgi:hypothetical protein